MMVSRQRFKNLANKMVTKTFSDFTKTFEFQSKVDTPDGQGGFTSIWSTFANITGFVKAVKAEKDELDDHIKSDVERKFSFEFIAGITSDMRILYSGDFYNIKPPVSIQDVDVWIDVIAVRAVAT